MAKGDIDKSDANGSQKQEKTKTGKDDKNPAPSTAKRSSSVNGTVTRKKTPASLGAPPKQSDELSATLGQLAKSMKVLTAEVKNIKQKQDENRENSHSVGPSQGDYFFPAYESWDNGFCDGGDYVYGAHEYVDLDAPVEHGTELVETCDGRGESSTAVNSQQDVNIENTSEEKQKEKTESNDIVSKFDQYLAEFITPSEETCADVSPTLASGVNNMFKKGMDFDVFRKKSVEILRPDNCVELRKSVDVDEIVYRQLKHDTKKFDERLKIISTAIVKAGCCLTKVVDGIQRLNSSNESESAVCTADELTETGMKGLAMLGHGFHNLCLRRRELQKQDLPWKYESLFSPDITHNEYLYGGNQNVERVMKDISTSNQLKLNLSGNKTHMTRGAFRYRGFGGPMRRGRAGRVRRGYHPYYHMQPVARGMYAYGMANPVMNRGRGHGHGPGKRAPAPPKGEVSLSLDLSDVDLQGSANSVIESEHDSTPFCAGRLSKFLHKWEELTSDDEILQTVAGCVIEFNGGVPPTQNSKPLSNFNKEKSAIVDLEIQKLLEKQVLEHTTTEHDEFCSNIFLVPKKNGTHRLILNLKQFNTAVEYHHFKMETFDMALKLISEGCFMASIDLKDAYYGVPVHPDFRKYLRFIWRDSLLQFTCLPNGLSCAPRKYTKLMKPVYAYLRRAGHAVSGFLDDMLIVASTETELSTSVAFVLQTLLGLGFVINYEKSVMVPCKRIMHLGFIIDSDSMMVTLPEEKVQHLVLMCRELAEKNMDTIRNVAKVIGSLVATFPAVQLGPLKYRELEHAKDNALKVNRGNFDAMMAISEEMKSELAWWADSLDSQFKPILERNPDVILTSDASTQGWGGSCETEQFGGRWNEHELTHHINYLELLGSFFVLKACEDKISDKCVLLMIDNTTAIAYLNHMGGKQDHLNKLAREIWQWCLNKNIWVSAAHLPGVENVEADYESRHFNDRCEWSLDKGIFHRLIEIYGRPEIDLFASRLNAKCHRYVAWQRDPQAEFIDAFSRPWTNLYAYIFPPFSLIGRVLQKIKKDQTEALVIVPCWPTQPWFTVFLQMLVQTPHVLPQLERLLTLEFNNNLHPLRKKLVLLAGKISGNLSENTNYLKGLPISFPVHGSQERISSTLCTYANGTSFVCRGRLITSLPLSMRSLSS